MGVVCPQAWHPAQDITGCLCSLADISPAVRARRATEASAVAPSLSVAPDRRTHKETHRPAEPKEKRRSREKEEKHRMMERGCHINIWIRKEGEVVEELLSVKEEDLSEGRQTDSRM